MRFRKLSAVLIAVAASSALLASPPQLAAADSSFACGNSPSVPAVSGGIEIRGYNYASCTNTDLVTAGAVLQRWELWSWDNYTAWKLVPAANKKNQAVYTAYKNCNGQGERNYRTRGRLIDRLGDDEYKYSSETKRTC